MKKTYILACLLMTLGISVQTTAQTDPGTVNLTHKWTFEDGTANDNVGTLNGTLMGTATVANGNLVTGDAGWVEFNAANLAINTYTELTVSAWFTSTAGTNNGYHFLYYFGNSDGNGNHFTGFTPARGNNVSRFMVSTTGEAGIDNTEFDDGLLHNVTCIIDATTVSYYMDGNLVNSVGIGTSTLANVGTQFAYIAKGGWNDPNWKGSLHELSVYNKSLNADNVKYLYDLNAPAAIPATDPGTTNLKHKWTFDDATATDIVGGVNGTLSGTDVSLSDKALNFNGGHLSLDGSALAINTYTELTVESWFASTAGANNGYHFLYYFGNSNGNGNHFTGFTPDRDGNPGQCGRIMIATGNGEDGQAVVNTAKFNDGRLHHMVSVIDATTVTAYLDGAFLGTSSIGTNALSAVGADLAYFAKGGWGGDPTWKGRLHEISIYNKALNANNVKYLYGLGAEQDVPTTINQLKKMIPTVFVSNNQIVVQFESQNVSSSKIEILNTQGSLLSTETFTCDEGLNTKTIKANYPAGIYMVRVNSAGHTTFTKIVK